MPAKKARYDPVRLWFAEMRQVSATNEVQAANELTLYEWDAVSKQLILLDDTASADCESARLPIQSFRGGLVGATPWLHRTQI